MPRAVSEKKEPFMKYLSQGKTYDETIKLIGAPRGSARRWEKESMEKKKVDQTLKIKDEQSVKSNIKITPFNLGMFIGFFLLFALLIFALYKLFYWWFPLLEDNTTNNTCWEDKISKIVVDMEDKLNKTINEVKEEYQEKIKKMEEEANQREEDTRRRENELKLKYEEALHKCGTCNDKNNLNQPIIPKNV